ncbi:TniQ family protein [Aetokthonos hydrillicola Thurmond2011]|uniref:TniQ family protein n=1 Tax=Aetokthonos hydrillicola Thurmond2011 TaxID=2712845 RepID=A0AAP5MBB5_9CYAN|nr:TniQ family protein [Aetokthonos hydrillicola]MBO3461553.1 TniQ family protein [Aetokthonos hydrillicola CCALA 1050]MBW4586145.1 TniQ family protein [Aetokthonos hydrillicola CCALA 1050]MDR9897752.1 TniQ family protein [Aetokthonos hydrillicola Thurmond2011]
MYASRRLIRRPRPYPDESLAGYIVRLTESNYYSLSCWIFQMSGLKKRGVYANVFRSETDDLSQLSFRSDVEESILWSMAFPSLNPWSSIYEDRVRVFGSILPTYTLTKSRVRLCPVCLQSKAYYRRIWDLSFVTSCPFHHCLLIDKCPICHQEIKWFQTSLVKCKCGQDWRDCQPQFVLSDQTALSLHIYKLCHIPGSESETNDILSLDNPVLKLNLESLVNLLFSLRRFNDIHYIREKFKARFKPETYSLRSDKFYFDTAFSILLNWQSEFYNLMSGYEKYLENPYMFISRRQNKYECLLFLFQSLLHCFSKQEYSFINKVIEDYFWDFLSKMSIKQIQVSLRQQFQSHSLRIPQKQWKTMNQQLVPIVRLEELTLAKLFAISELDIYDDTIFFTIYFNPFEYL